MAEWLKAHAWKACLGETLTWVRIPLSPPAFLLFRFTALQPHPSVGFSGNVRNLAAGDNCRWPALRMEIKPSGEPAQSQKRESIPQTAHAGIRRSASGPS